MVRATTVVTSGLVVTRTTSGPPLCRTRSFSAISTIRGAPLGPGVGSTTYVNGFGEPLGAGEGLGGTGVVVAAGDGAAEAGAAGPGLGCGAGEGAAATSAIASGTA